MSDQPVDVLTMLRQALSAQIDLGVSEVVITRRPVEPIPPVVATAPEPIANLFGEDLMRKKLDLSDSPDRADMRDGKRIHFQSLKAHCEAIHDCRLCPLFESRNKFVYGVGNPKAGLMFIGEAPGADEDRIGEPFVGRAGKLLDKILAAINFTREEVYIANILKCRPPNNRDPQPAEVSHCLPYLHEQIRIIRPKLLCSLGRIAGQTLLQTTTPLGKLRGVFHDYQGVPMLITYHPAALLRFPEYKKDTWADMQMLRARYDELTK